MIDILTPISTDHSLLLFSLSKEKSTIRGTGICKFNSSLTRDQNNKTEVKKLIRNFSNEIESLLNRQFKWELLNIKLENLLLSTQNMLQKKNGN